MATVTKKDLIDRITRATGEKRVTTRRITQSLLDSIIVELGRGNRLEFRDFGVFELKHRAARAAQNPKTLERVEVPPKSTVKFKPGRMMKQAISDGQRPQRATSQSTVGGGKAVAPAEAPPAPQAHRHQWEREPAAREAGYTDH